MINSSRLYMLTHAVGAISANIAASADKGTDEPTSQQNTCNAEPEPTESRQVRRHRERQEAKRNKS